jgi:hypothetical protein
VSEQLSDKSVTNFNSVAVEQHRAECCLLAPIWDCADNPLCRGAPAQRWAKELVTGTGMGASVHFLSVFLILKDDGDMFCMAKELRISV